MTLNNNIKIDEIAINTAPSVHMDEKIYNMLIKLCVALYILMYSCG